MHIESATISGYLIGDIWMPATEVYKSLEYDMLREQARTIGGRMTLRDHCLSATNDGDFRYCAIADGVINFRIRNGRYTRNRSFPLSMFPSIADMVRLDWDGPSLAFYG